MARNIVLAIILALGFLAWSQDEVNFNLRALVDNDARTLRAFGPTVVQAGVPFHLTIEAWDYCERLSCNYAGVVSLSCTDPAATLPPAQRFQPSGIGQGLIEAWHLPFGDGGLRRVEVVLRTPGIHYIFLDDDRGLSGMSNPIVVSTSKPNRILAWGDIHGHSIWCDGSGYLTETYRYARDIACLDFAAITPHDHFVEPVTGPATWESWWNVQKQVTNDWNEPGHFVTLLAYEYRGEFLNASNGVGDMVVYSKHDDVPFYPGFLESSTRPDGLFENLREWEASRGLEPGGIMCIPHHTASASYPGMTYDWSYFNSTFIRLAEVYSVHGSSVFPGYMENKFPIMEYKMKGNHRHAVNAEINETGYYVADALAMGYRVGFMASGDSHDGHPGHSISHTDANNLLQPPNSWKAYPHLFRTHHVYPNGLAAVWINGTISRETVFDALWNRACYGVKGTGRTFVNFTINGKMVGDDESIIQLPSPTTPRLIQATIAAGGGPVENVLESVTIFKNNIPWLEIHPGNRTTSIQVVDTAPLRGMNYTTRLDGNTYTNGEVREDGNYYITGTADIPLDPGTLNTGGADVYFLRIYETGGGAAWAGPFWVS